MLLTIGSHQVPTADFRKVFPATTAELLELAVHPLRLQVLVAEVRADMWRKNGAVTMTSQVKHYYTTLRHQMLERDLALLQVLS